MGAALRNRPPLRLAVAAGVIGCLGFAAAVETGAARGYESDPGGSVAAQTELLRRAESTRDTSRGEERAPVTPAATAAEQPPTSEAATEEPPPEQAPGSADPDVAAAEQAPPAPSESPAAPAVPANVAPVVGLSQVQMDNATAIVVAGLDLQMPRRAMVIAVATAMQESTLLNRASEVLPESKNHPHQGTGWDHDSVGLFQQRTSTGWGAVADLMNPTYAATQFYVALNRVPGWQQLRLAEAAQAVQISAYPDHYARHEANAEAVVAAILGDGG